MRRILLSLIGALIVLPLAAHAQVYDMIKRGVELDQTPNPADPNDVPIEQDISSYVASVFADKKISVNDVKLALKNDQQKFCEGKGVGCADLMKEVVNVVLREERVRVFGRKLQTTAAGYEMPLSEFPGSPMGLPGIADDSYGDILKLWSAGSGRYVNGMTATGFGLPVEQFEPYSNIIDVPSSMIEGEMQELQGALGEISDEIERTWAVRRYVNGVRLVRGERENDYDKPDDYGQAIPGTTLQFDLGKWTKIEAALDKIMQKLPRTTPATIKFEDEKVIDNVILWARVGKVPRAKPDEDDPDGLDDMEDIGFAFNFPLTPAFPPIFAWGHYGCVEGTDETGCGGATIDMILGGLYPAEPIRPIAEGEDPENAVWEDENGTPFMAVDGQGLCTHPRAMQGYLCRANENEGACEDVPIEGDPNEISIVTCGKATWTKKPPAANLCRSIAWRQFPAHWPGIGPVEDPSLQCAVDPKIDLACGECDEGGSLKRGDGHITVCADTSLGGATYGLIHGLAHAEQRCTLAPGELPIDDKNCCSVEGEAFRAQCQELARDGIFTNPDGSPIIVNNVTLSASVCAEVLTAESCNKKKGFATQCPVSRTYPDAFADELRTHVNGRVPPAVPTRCEDAINPTTMDTRVRDSIIRLNGRYDVCSPNNYTAYGNRIGNNLCFIAECSREVADYHLIEGGRTATNVTDESFPWDHIAETQTFGEVVQTDAQTINKFPEYRPELLMQEFDASVCEEVGQPPRAPVVLCLISPRRRLSAPLQDPIAMANDIIAQVNGAQQQISDVQRLAPAVGIRIAEKTHEGFESAIGGAFTKLLKTTNDLLEKLKATKFPSQMCPVDDKRPTPPEPAEESSS
jgi:hypothetical protein